jgi:cytochrome oxidase Cu insertion factor (SCO1/SenC/PrrC family)
VSVSPPSNRFPWLKVALFAGALAVGAGVGIGVAVANRSGGNRNVTATAPSDAGFHWPAGARPAPDFTLRDQSGRTFSLRSLRGRAVILAFIDPVCRNLCPLEAKVLNDVPGQFPASSRPAIVAVSVNPWNQTSADLRLDAVHWKLVPEWRWALGSYAPLAKVWQQYAIGVRVTTKTLAGVTVHQIAHTEAAYVIDPDGYERALFVFPYRAEDVVNAVRRVTAGRSSSSRG